jgi:DNA primase
MPKRKSQKERDQADLDEIRHKTSLSKLVGKTVQLQFKGGEFKGLCPFHTEKTPSFTVDDEKGLYKCFGCDAKGDVFNWIMETESLTFPQAIERLGGKPARTPAATTPEERDAERLERQRRDDDRRAAERSDKAKRERSIHTARDIWRESKPAAGTPVEAYLRSRSITVDIPPTIRFHPELQYRDDDIKTTLPAMVGAVQSPDGHICAIHRTYLAACGSGKANVSSVKKMLGPVQGCAIRFGRPDRALMVAEGIETALSIMQAFPPDDSDAAVWGALSLNNFGLWVPDRVGRLIYCCDNDNADPAKAEKIVWNAAQHHIDKGRDVRVCWATEGMDFNDMLNSPGVPRGDADAPF